MSQAFCKAEARYPGTEMLVFTLVVAARKLRPYFQDHSMKVLTNVPLKKILQKPDTSGQLAKWAIELSNFNIEYLPRTVIKG